MRGFFRVLMTAVLPIVAVIACTGGGVYIMSQAREKPETAEAEPRGLAVFVEQAVRAEAVLAVTTQGEARPRREIDLVPQVSGKIVAVADSYEAGGFFEEGDTLIRIEDADYRLAVTRAEATVAQAQRILERERAESEIARRDWEELGEGEASPLALRQPQLAEAEASLAAARAQAEDARLQLARTRLTAPFDSRLREKTADLGQFVSPGQRVGRLFSTDIMQVRLPLTDSELALLDLPLAFEAKEGVPGPEVTLSAVVAGKERIWNGRIARTDSALDPRTRTLGAIVEVQDPYGEGADDDMPLAAGLFVNAHIVGRVVPDAYALPRAALRGAATVYVANTDGTLDIRQVEVVSTDRDRVVISSGVFDDEHIVVSPILSAQQGMAIEAYNAEGVLLFPERPEEPKDGDEDGDTDETNETDDAEDQEAVASALEEPESKS